MDILDRLVLVWRTVKWLDDARWTPGASLSPIPGPVFASLEAPAQVLTHWLVYITDQQRPFEQVWAFGGPIFSEVVSEYQKVSKPEEVLDLLCVFTEPNPDPKKKVDVFRSRYQTIEGEKFSYTTRFGSHLVSIARTLHFLVRFNKSFAVFFSNHSSFVLKQPSFQNDSPTARMAFLMYLVSYDQIPLGLTSFHGQNVDFGVDIESNSRFLEEQLQSDEKLEELYKWWFSEKRFHKRLWASFRDYIKPGSPYEGIFLHALDLADARDIRLIVNEKRQQLLSHLELPGDLWNLRFNQYLFNNEVTSPAQLRKCYDELLVKGYPMEGFYPEQFDISFDFAPRMCDARQESICPFRMSSKLTAYCVYNQGYSTTDKMCSVTKLLCGYETRCSPTNCPILIGVNEDICSGCRFKLA